MVAKTEEQPTSDNAKLPVSTVFEHQWSGFSKIKDRKVYSENFRCGGFEWRILCFPRGNGGLDDHLSLYLDVPDAAKLPAGWSRCAQFFITVLSQYPTKSQTREASHRFVAEESDWGFVSFLKLSQLYDPSTGYLVQDKLTVQIKVTVVCETVLRASLEPSTYDSKKETGFVGLKNQGATCYMNSLLQAMFHTSPFRLGVYHMPTQQDDVETSIALALQRVFFRLQCSSTAVSTIELTKSFGWSTHEIFTQHDVQELNRVLCDNLEEKMKGTTVEGRIQELYEGKIKNFIKCVDIDFESSRTESFLDLSLNVKGCKDLLSSFAQYVEVEKMDGDNKYMAEGFGLQDAKKGCSFLSFPPVLQLQLKRFEYDPNRDANVKVNDRFEFEETLDLDQFLDPSADRTVRNLYVLHSVLVHSGDVNGGHYYAFIRPRRSGSWYKFDDERVTKAEVHNALHENFGCADVTSLLSTRRFSNAYMLVYMREAELDTLQAEVGDGCVPDHLKVRFGQELAVEEAQKKERDEAHLYTQVKAASVTNLSSNPGMNLLPFDSVAGFKTKKDSTLADFVATLQEQWELKKAPLVWLFGVTNKITRLDRFIPSSAWGTTVIKDLMAGGEVKLLVLSPEDMPELREPKEEEFLVILKFYRPEKEELRFLSCATVSKRMKVADLLPAVRKREQLSANTGLRAYQESKWSTKEAIDPKTPFGDSDIAHGDIICVQTTEECPTAEFPTVPSYYDHLVNRVNVSFRHRVPTSESEEPLVIGLSKTLTYDQVCQRLGAALSVDPLYLTLTAHNSFMQQPKPTPIKRKEGQTLQEMLPAGPPILYFDVLEFSVKELETKRLIRVAWHKEDTSLVATHSLLVPKTGTVQDIIDQIQELEKPTRPIRIMEVKMSKIVAICPATQSVSKLFAGEILLRAEEISEEEVNMDEHTKTIHVHHFSRPLKYFGLPFVLTYGPKETVGQLRARICAKLGLAKEEVDIWKIAVVTYMRPDYLNDDDILAERSPTGFLGLDHYDSSAANRSNERQVKLYN